MARERDFGRAVPRRVNVLPELSFDMFEGRAIPADLGKTATPVNVLPGLTFDMLAEQQEPVLLLTIQFRAGAEPCEVARDLHRLYVVANEFDLSHGGGGLLPIETASSPASTNGRICVALRPANPSETLHRLNELVEELNTVASEGMIETCQAQVLPRAA